MYATRVIVIVGLCACT